MGSKPSLDEIIYMAATLDGEGSLFITLHRDGHQYEPAVSVTQANLAWLQQFLRVWGGGVYPRADKRKTAALTWAWVLRGAPVAEFLKGVQPYLRLKSEQAKILLELQGRINRISGKGRGGLSKEELAIRRSLYKRCRLLNRTGPRNDQLQFELKVTEQLPLPWERD